MMEIYFDEVPLDESEIAYISEEYSVPYDIAQELINAYKIGKPISEMAYSGILRQRVKTFISLLSKKDPLAIDESKFAEAADISLVRIPEAHQELPEESEPVVWDDVSTEKATQVATMMQIVTDPISEFFTIREGGQATLRADNPPTLPQAYQVIDRIFVARDLTNKIDDYSTWLLGSITAELENYFGSQFEISQVGEISEKAYNTIVTAVGVFKEYNGNKYALSFSHHKEAFYSKIPKEDKHTILAKAEAIQLSAKDVRSLASLSKKIGMESIKLLTDQQQAKDLIASCKDATVDYIVCGENNIWKRTKSMMPQTGKIVINLKDNTIQIGELKLNLQK